MENVLLLRARTEDGPDKYEDAFSANGYHPVSVPVLETALVKLEALKDIVASGSPSERYAGVVITSARACEAWRTVVQQLREKGTEHTADWTYTPFYVVGEATAAALREIHAAFPESPHVPVDIRGAAEAGTSERLAHFIIEDLKDTTRSRTLLYLTGDKNRDTLPKILQQGGFELSSLQVYATRGSSAFASNLRAALQSHPSDATWWIVFFAPSAADYVTPFLREHFDLRSTDTSTLKPSLPLARVAAIGPTTSVYLTDSLKLHVDIVSPQPKPESLVKAIVEFDAIVN